MSNPDFIEVYEGALTRAQCDGLIARFEEIETSPQGWEFAPLANLRYLKHFWIRT